MKTYLCILLIVFASTILCTAVVSMIVDPYCIVHPLVGEFSFEPNSRVPKVTYISDNCSRCNAYFLGDSRSMTLSESDLGDAHGRRFYNFATPADDIGSIVRRLNYVIGRGCPISAVVVGESIDVLMDENERIAYGLLLSENPVVSRESRIAFYSKFFLSAQALTTYVRAELRDPAPRSIYHPDGHADYLFGMQDGAAFALARCGRSPLELVRKDLLFAKLSGYREIARLSDRYHFKTIVWVTPLNERESHFLANPDIEDFLRQLRSIPNLSVIEGDRNSPLISDFRAWHDCGHFRRIVFDRLVAPAVSELLGDSAAGV